MQTIIKKDGKEYSCKVWNSCLTGYVDIGFAEVKYPNRKICRCGFFVYYETFTVDVEEFDDVNWAVKQTFEKYLEKIETEKRKKEETKSKFALDKVIEL